MQLTKGRKLLSWRPWVRHHQWKRPNCEFFLCSMGHVDSKMGLEHTRTMSEKIDCGRMRNQSCHNLCSRYSGERNVTKGDM
jgi:hypothetical protein